MFEDEAEYLMRKASEAGVQYAEVRFEDTTYETLAYVNGRVSEMGQVRIKGAGVRVFINGSVGFAATSDATKEGLLNALKEAISIAKALGSGRQALSKEETRSGTFEIRGIKEHPREVEWDVKIELMRRAYEQAKGENTISALSRYAAYYGVIDFFNIEGSKIHVEPLLIGLSAFSVTKVNGGTGDGSETIGGSRGLELFKERTPEEVGKRAYEKALEKAKAKYAPAGIHVVIITPRLAGVFAHESFGHLSEADNIVNGVSPLSGRLGEKIASEEVTIVDSGIVPEGGYFMPVDDEGIPTQKVVLVERGVLRGYLQSRETAAQLGTRSTGNARAQDYRHEPIVRMRNTFFERGNWKKEEIIEETKNGILVEDPRGGQANLDGTFTFTASRGYIVEGGELKEPIRDVVLAGNILEMLKFIDAVSHELELFTSPFGGCGKWGQRAFVGLGGSTLRVKKLMVGGRRG